MTGGLNLEPFLHLLRADLGAWLTLGIIVVLLALMAWTSWGSRRALRKCLVLSVLAHVGLVFYGSAHPVFLLPSTRPGVPNPDREGIREIRVAPILEGRGAGEESRAEGRGGWNVPLWDLPAENRQPLAVADLALGTPRPDFDRPSMLPDRHMLAPPALDANAPEVNPPEPTPIDDHPEPAPLDAPEPEVPAPSLDVPGEIAPVVVPRTESGDPIAPILPGAGRLSLRPEASTNAIPAPRVERTPLDLAAVPSDAPDLTIPTPGNEPPPNAPQTADNLQPTRETDAGAIGVAGVQRPAAAPEPSELPLPGGSSRDRVRPESNGTPSLEPGARPPIDLPNVAANSAPAVVPENREPESEPTPSTGPDLRPPSASGGDPNAVAGVQRPERPASDPTSDPARPDLDVRSTARSSAARTNLPEPIRTPLDPGPLALNRVIPSGLPDLPGVRGATGGRPLADVPEVYRPRLDPNRAVRARQAGASDASEQAVERALNWLARHQDADGRWNAGTAKYGDGSVAQGDHSFTAHCPPGDICHGECYYWEADTAVTGLALLAYLGAGYTHTDGKYAQTVGKGIDFLVLTQKPDGDLRGRSKAVGMYCHTMAALALSEAYALTDDPRLKEPVENALKFLVAAQYPGKLAWRYAPRGEIQRKPGPDNQGTQYTPHPPVGDTSILGWVVMVLKSASVVGIETPATARAGALGWLEQVADGDHDGLARYQPHRPADPTMTAEAWVCRQFLGTGGPSPTSTEAAEYLLDHAPGSDNFNIYYWYYATLAMYQHGGPVWDRWNDLVRDQLVHRQHLRGHKAGSWDPDPTQYGSHGGRIYTTALAAMTLEVYYRYLRLYDAPATSDGSFRRAGGR